MLRWLRALAALMMCVSTPCAAASVDCGPTPTVKCLAAAMFSLAKTLPEDGYFRKHVEFAEQELAPGDIKVALEYEIADAPDAPPWEDIDWIAKAGRFDRAIQLAKQRAQPATRLGGLLAVASYLLDRKDTTRASKIVDEVERDLRSLQDDTDDYASLIPQEVGKLRARLGQIERSARLLSGSGEASVDVLLDVAKNYPPAVSLREQAWREAEKVNKPYVWQLLVEDAIDRGDQADLTGVGQKAVAGLAGVLDAGHAELVIPLARKLQMAGLSELAAKLIAPWPQWINGKDAMKQRNVLVLLIPVLAALGRDKDVEAATHAVSSVSDRSECLSKAAEEYFRLGRSDIATRFDIEAMRAAESSPTGEPKLQLRHNAALNNLALARAGRGDIQGALFVVSDLRDETKIREATSYVVRRAIDGGQGPVAGPAIQALAEQARAIQDVGLLLQAANAWYEIGNEDDAHQCLDQAMNMVVERHTPLAASDAGLAAELTWRIDGNGEAKAMLPIVDKLEVSDPSAIDHLVEIMKTISPAIAVQLAGRQTEVEREIDELAAIGIAIAEGAK